MNQAPIVLPQDAYNSELVSNVHPPEWENPTPASRYNMVVIGAGTAGIVAATGAGVLGGKVAIVERDLLGGDCLNWGCVPSKSLIRSARAAHDAHTLADFGVHAQNVTVDFQAVMERVRRVRAKISYHDSVKHFEKYNVDLFFGEAAFRDMSRLLVNGQVLNFKKAIIATGARAAHPPIPGLEEAGFLTNETVFSLTELPKRLAVIGGGPIGCELAQAFQRLGSDVTLLHDMAHILPKEDSDVADVVQHVLVREGMRLVLNAKITQVTTQDATKVLHYESTDESGSVTVDEILVGAGRIPNVEGLNLEAVGVRYNLQRGVFVNDYMQTSNPDVYAAGDVCMPYKFTHVADSAARIALQNALFMGRERLSTLTIPWCTFTDPEVAHVGLSEQEAIQKGVDVDTYAFDMQHLDRAIIEGEEEGFIKMLVKSGTDQLVGATIVGRDAGAIINELTLAITAGVGLKKLNTVIHPYPVHAEVIRKVSDAFNMTRLTPVVKGLSTVWLDWTK